MLRNRWPRECRHRLSEDPVLVSVNRAYMNPWLTLRQGVHFEQLDIIPCENLVVRVD